MLKIQPGQIWYMRNGQRVIITKVTSHDNWPIQGHPEGEPMRKMEWTKDGRYHSRIADMPYDLIKREV